MVAGNLPPDGPAPADEYEGIPEPPEEDALTYNELDVTWNGEFMTYGA